jgi:hypothetical protein
MKQRWVRLRVAGVANVVGVVATSPRIGRVDSTSAFETIINAIAAADCIGSCCLLLLLVVPAAVGDLEEFRPCGAALGSEKPCCHTCLKCVFSMKNVIWAFV